MSNEFASGASLVRVIGMTGIGVGIAWVLQIIATGAGTAVAQMLWIVAAAAVCGASFGIVLVADALGDSVAGNVDHAIS